MNVQWTIKHTIVKTNLFGFGTYFAPYVLQVEDKNTSSHRSIISISLFNSMHQKLLNLIFQLSNAGFSTAKGSAKVKSWYLQS